MAAQYIDPMAWNRFEGARRLVALTRRGPSPCPVCGQWCLQRPCVACLARFAAPHPRCTRCATALPDSGQTLCGACVRHPPPFERAVCAFDYRFPWDGLIAALKFGADLSVLPALAGPLIDRLTQADAADAREVDWVLPMPLAPLRLRERGFNQSWEIARRVAAACRRPAHAGLLWRWRETPHQTGLHRDERSANLRGAFMPAPGARAWLAGRHVALVDDVMTTGASATEASQALREAGADRVTLWLLARTPDAPAG